jgi:hypothetical protein
LTVIKSELRIASSNTDYDALIERLIMQVSDAFVSICDRKFHYTTDVVEKLRGYGTTRIYVSRTPVVAITSLKVDGSDYVEDTDYTCDKESGELYRKGGWPNTATQSVGVTYDALPGSEERAIVVTYDGGWVTPEQARADVALTRTLPYDLEGLAIDAVVTLFRDKGENKAIKSSKFNGVSVEIERGRYGLPKHVVESLEANWCTVGQA